MSFSSGEVNARHEENESRGTSFALSEPKRVKVAIIGAGAAGLQCAHDLLTRHRAGEGNDLLLSPSSLEPDDIIILEARDRVGGRIYSTDETRISVTTQEKVNFVMDHGAAWIHGTGEDDHVGETLQFSDGASSALTTTSTTLPSMTSSESSSASSSSSSQSSSSVQHPKKNPMMVLLEQVTPEGESVFGTHVKPIFCGNPWMRPEYVLHNHDEIVLFFDGKRLEPNSPLIERALRRHFDIFDQVSDIGDDMYEKGLGIETSRTSLQETISKILNSQKLKEIADLKDKVVNAIATAVVSSSSSSSSSDSQRVEIDTAAVERVANFYQHLMECWFGSPSNYLQLAGFLEGSDDESMLHDERYAPEGDFPGPHCTVKSGMRTVLRPLLQDGVEGCIQLQQAVTRITQIRSSGAGDDDHPKVELQTSNGLVVHADCCVLSIPLGCLQRSIIRRSQETKERQVESATTTKNTIPSLSFEPALSEEKCEAIHTLRMGCYKKVFLTFDRIFWPPKQSFMGLIRNQEVDVHVGRKDCKSENLGNYLLIDNLWARDGIPCLEAILISQAGEWSIGKSDEVIRNAVLDFLQDTMNIEADKVFEWCVDCHITRWEEDAWSCGAYSSFSVGALERHADALAQSEWTGQLVFCGEATFAEFEGSVHAALMSGQRAAESVHGFLRHPAVVEGTNN